MCVCLTNRQSQICEIQIENLSAGGGRGRNCASHFRVLQKPSWSEVRRMCVCVSMGHVFSALLPRLCACGSQTLQQVHQTKSALTLRANRCLFAFSLTLTAAQKPRYDLSVRDF